MEIAKKKEMLMKKYRTITGTTQNCKKTNLKIDSMEKLRIAFIVAIFLFLEVHVWVAYQFTQIERTQSVMPVSNSRVERHSRSH